MMMALSLMRHNDMLTTVSGALLLACSLLLVVRHRSRLAQGAFIVSGLLWLIYNAPVEGPTLLHLVAKHGLTAGDLMVPAAALPGVVARLLGESRSPAQPER